MKNLILFIGLCTFLGCNSPQNIPELNKATVEQLVADSIITGYINSHPNWSNNEELTDEAGDQLSKEYEPYLRDGSFFEKMPFKLDGVVSYIDENGGKAYLANFNFDYSKFPTGTLSSKLSMQVIGLINTILKNELVEGEDYYLTGKMLLYRSKGGIMHTRKTINNVYLPTVRAKITAVKSIQNVASLSASVRVP